VTSRISRRELLQGGASAGLALGLWACGASSPTPSPSGSPSASPGSTLAPTPSASIPPSPSPTAPPSPTQEIALETRIARLLLAGFRGLTLEEAGATRADIADRGLGGVILFSTDQLTGKPRNITSPDQVTKLVADLHALAPGRTLLVATDQEGGKVARLGPATGFPPVPSQAAVGGKSDAVVEHWANSIAGTLADVGINFNLAPVVDLNVNPHNPAIGALGRSFSADPDVVAHDASISVKAHRAVGVRTALKHFPGLGSATANTDVGVADVTDTWSRTELEPYRTLLAAHLVDSIMVGNLVNGQIDSDTPASLSTLTVTDFLRGELGWRGLVVTDDLQAGAVTDAFGAEEAIRMAIEAGNDLLLLANQQTFDPDLVAQTIELIAGFVQSGTISASRINQSYDRVVAFAGR
jgi:beta-N-acetylhexosaminidase